MYHVIARPPHPSITEDVQVQETFSAPSSNKQICNYYTECLNHQSSQSTMTFTGTFVYMVHHFILLQLNPFELRVDREGW